MTQQPLKGTKLVTLALNVPGPVAAARLAEMGAEVIKVEPPSGDPLRTAARAWYEALTEHQTVISLDLKQEEDRTRLDHFLVDAQLLLTSFRPSALKRMKLDWDSLRQRFPRLSAVNIIGFPSPDEELPGHDLTYQAKLGLLRPPQLPITLYADMAGAERAVTTCLALLLNRTRSGHTDHANVSLYEAMRDVAGPLTAGLTKAGGVLGGGFPFYGLYECSDGWIAVAALEPRFMQGLTAELNLSANARAELEKIFRTRTAAEWEQWAKERDLPISAVAMDDL
jgi:crotonobetainyl-CoA:carnitine CoA-transferase CaiB-like acyl-CoA transferase